jgi:hypothetical protein
MKKILPLLLILASLAACNTTPLTPAEAEARHVKQVAEERKQQDYKTLTTALSY